MGFGTERHTFAGLFQGTPPRASRVPSRGRAWIRARAGSSVNVPVPVPVPEIVQGLIVSVARDVLYRWLMVRLLIALTASLASACSGSPAAAAGGEAGAGGAASPVDAVSVEVGVPAGPDGLDFEPMPAGSELRLQTFGQGGTHVLVAVRSAGFGKRAFVSATLRNLTTDVEVEEPAPARPQLLYCGDDGFCDLVPYLVHASGIAADEERDGLRVLLTAQVRNEAGAQAEASIEAVLSTADL